MVGVVAGGLVAAVALACAAAVWLLAAWARHIHLYRKTSAVLSRSFPRAPGLWPLLSLLRTDPAALQVPARLISSTGSTGFALCGPFCDGSASLLVVEPSALARIFTNPHIYQKSALNEPLKAMLGLGLVTSEGAHWAAQRKSLSPLFRATALRRMMGPMQREINTWVERFIAVDGRQPVAIYTATSELSLRLLNATLFGKHQVPPEIGHAWHRLGESTMAFFATSFFVANPAALPLPHCRQFVSAVATVRHHLRLMMQESEVRLGSSLPEPSVSAEDLEEDGGASGIVDVIDELLCIRDEDGNRRMSMQQIEDECFTFLIAGSETTSSTLSFALTLLAQHPDIQLQLYAELSDAVGCLDDDGGAPANLGVDGDGSPVLSDEQLRRCVLLRAVVTETLRLYPPVCTTSRRAVVADALCGQAIPAGTTVLLSLYTIGRDERVWGESAPLFQPQRWLRAAPTEGAEDSAGAAIGRWAWLPFTAGPRICLGMNFARTEISLTLATLILAYSVHVFDGCVPAPTMTTTLHCVADLVFRPRR